MANKKRRPKRMLRQKSHRRRCCFDRCCALRNKLGIFQACACDSGYRGDREHVGVAHRHRQLVVVSSSVAAEQEGDR